MWQEAKEETHLVLLFFFLFFFFMPLSVEAAVSQGWCVVAIYSACIRVSAEQQPQPNPHQHSHTNSTQAGWETALSSCVRKAKTYHTERIFEAVGRINVADYVYLRGDGSRDEGATARVLTAELAIEAHWYCCGLENVAPSPLDAGTGHPSVDLTWYIDEMNPKALGFQKFHLPCQLMYRW